MPLADAHIHLFRNGFPLPCGRLFPATGGELRAYEGLRRGHGIDRALIVGYERDRWARGNNQYIAQQARRHTWMIPVAYCPPAGPGRASQFLRWWRDGFYGVTFYIMTETDLGKVLKLPEAACAALNRRRAIVSFNTPIRIVARLRPLLLRLPDTTVMISHLGLPGEVRRPLRLSAARQRLAPLLRLMDLPHVGVKLSGFYGCNAYPHPGTAPMVAALRRTFGDARLYWGSDFSPALGTVTFPQTLQAVRNAGVSPRARRIFHGNLCAAAERVRRSG